MTRSLVDSSSCFPPSYTNSSQQTAASATAYNFSQFGNESESNNTRFNNNNSQQYLNYHHHHQQHQHQQGEYCSTESTLIQPVQSNNELGVKSSNIMQVSSNNANDYEMVLNKYS